MIFLANDRQIVRVSAVGFSLPVADDSAGLTPDLRHSLARHSVAGIDASSVVLCGALGGYAKRTGVSTMPVVECSCGMVMSISGAKPRNTCIRCGSAEFRALDLSNQLRLQRSLHRWRPSQIVRRFFRYDYSQPLAKLPIVSELSLYERNGKV
jgi:hypothetical protein